MATFEIFQKVIFRTLCSSKNLVIDAKQIPAGLCL